MSSATPLWPRMVFGLVAVLLLAGLAELFRARFATGDVYPPYSSLRGDPLGTRVLHEALDLAGIEVARSFRDPARVDPGAGTIYLGGMRWGDFTRTTTRDMRALLDRVHAGGRLVIAFVPQDAEITLPPGPPAPGEGKRPERRGERLVLLPSELALDARWLPALRDGRHEAARVGDDDRLPAALPWRTALVFEPGDDAWRRVYGVGRYAAILERDYGAGTIVVMGDAYHLSNEAAARDRRGALLAWLQGPHRRAVFDETHLGVVENTGIAALARRYGLTHAALGLIAVALLYLWRSGSSLVPPAPRRDAAAGELTGRDASAGLRALLRRTVAPADLPASCLAEYRHAAPWRRLPDQTRRALEALVASADRRRPLEAVRAAHTLLQRKH